MTFLTRRHALVLVAALAAACSKTTPEPERTSEGPAPVPAPVRSSVAPVTSGATAGGSAAGPEEIGYEAPKAWQSVPNPNQMRKATFKVPRAAGDAEDAELAVSAATGGLDQNIERWSGQFGNAKATREDRKPNSLKVTVVELKGTFASGGGMMGGASVAKPGYMLLGAIVDGGDRLHFFKLTGPEKTVTAAKKDFDAFVASFRAK